MPPVRAIIFDLGGTLLEFPNWDVEMAARWRSSYHFLSLVRQFDTPAEDDFVLAMVEAEQEHWRRVDAEHWSGPPSGLVREGYRRLGRQVDEETIIDVLDACARSLDGWARPFPDAIPTLERLRALGLRIGLLSNTWWAADWHNADLATHGLHPYLDELVYTSDLPHSKPHPAAFGAIAGRLGVANEECVMVGDRPLDDVGGGLSAGMRAVLKTNGHPPEVPPHVQPTAVIAHLAELPPLVEAFGIAPAGAVAH